MATERTGHPPSCAKITKVKSLKFHTHGYLRAFLRLHTKLTNIILIIRHLVFIPIFGAHTKEQRLYQSLQPFPFWSPSFCFPFHLPEHHLLYQSATFHSTDVPK